MVYCLQSKRDAVADAQVGLLCDAYIQRKQGGDYLANWRCSHQKKCVFGCGNSIPN